MFAWVRDIFGSKSAAEERRQNPVLSAAVDQSAVVYSQIPLHRFISEERRDQLARSLYLDVNNLCNTKDPIATCREQLAASMLTLSTYQVLVVPPPPQPDPFALRDQPGITGELRPHLDALLEKNDELRSALFREDERDAVDDHWEFIQRQFWISHWHMETLNAARVAMGDTVEGSDWKLLFVHAASVNSEHLYRWDLQLPSAFDEDVAKEAATAYSVFTDIVVSGAQDPALEWRDYYKDSGIPMPDLKMIATHENQ